MIYPVIWDFCCARVHGSIMVVTITLIFCVSVAIIINAKRTVGCLGIAIIIYTIINDFFNSGINVCIIIVTIMCIDITVTV